MLNKTYCITRYDPSTVECRVLQDGKASYELPHVAAHSPTGFNCGYAGSGPADLALSILTDFFGETSKNVLDTVRGYTATESRAVSLHQHFKADIIAQIHLQDGGEQYQLRASFIDNWIGIRV